MPHCNKKMISFFLTTKCNLCCRYCYCVLEREKIQEISLDVEVAKAGIDWYFSHYPYRHIRFYGPGEPTQEFRLMKQIVEYAKERNDSTEEVTVEIQSNGVFTEEVRQWLLDNATIV